MRHQIRLTQQAKQDLRDIWRGFAEFSGLKIADDRLKIIQQKFKLFDQPKALRVTLRQPYVASRPFSHCF